MKKVEYLPIVDENGAVIGKATREECHRNPKLLHPVIRLHVFNSKGQILMQQRAFNKSVEPGKWDAAVAGHVNYGETAEETVVRETQEEIGITPKDFHFIEKRILTVDKQSELVLVYFTITDENPKADYDEVVDIKFCNIEDAISNDMAITPAFEFEYNMLIKLRKNIFKNK